MSTMYRSHKMLPASCKISSLYVFDALSRAARQQVIKHNLSERQATGNCATFLSKVAGVLEGLFQDILAVGLPEAKVSFAGTAYGRPMRLYEVDKIPFYVPLTVGCVSLISCPRYCCRVLGSRWRVLVTRADSTEGARTPDFPFLITKVVMVLTFSFTGKNQKNL